MFNFKSPTFDHTRAKDSQKNLGNMFNRILPRFSTMAYVALVYSFSLIFSSCTTNFALKNEKTEDDFVRTGRPPKTTLVVDGWRVKFAIGGNPGDINYLVKNEATNSVVACKNNDFLIANADSSDFKKIASLPLSPLDSNKITAIFLVGGFQYEFDTTLAASSTVCKFGNTEVYSEEAGYLAQQLQIAKTVEKLNARTPGKKQVVLLETYGENRTSFYKKILRFTDGITDSLTQNVHDSLRLLEKFFNIPTDSNRMIFSYASGFEIEGKIKGYTSALRFSELRRKVYAFHEAAHSLFLNSIDNTGMENLYNQLSNKSRKMFTYSRTTKQIRQIRETGPLRLLDESNYFDVEPEVGHPGTDKSELFASTATVLYMFPKKFISELKKEGKKDKESAALARSAAQRILKKINYNYIFDIPMLKELGIYESKAK